MWRDVSEIDNRYLLRWMFGFLRPVKKLMLLACAYLMLWTAADILTVRQTAAAVNRIRDIAFSRVPPETGFRVWISGSAPEAAALRHVILVLGGCTLVLCVVTYLREVTNTRMSMQGVFFIREAVYDKLQRVGFRFHDAMSTGELINRSLTDLQNVRQFINSSVLISLEILLYVVGYTTLLMTRSPWVAGLALMPVPIWTWYILRFSRAIQPAIRAAMEAGDSNISLITENIAGVHVVKAFATEPYEIRKYERNCDRFFARVMRRIRMYANFTPIIRSIAIASHLSLFLAAGVLMIRRELAPGDILMLGAAMGAILGRLQQVAVINEQYQSAIVSARRLHEVLAAAPTVAEPAGARELPDGPGAVKFEHVTFGYDPGKPVLRDVSFEVKGGSVVAIVGPTGAGKTTLVSLISRFYDPQQGRVLIDGVDVRDVSLESLRKQVAFVFQETYLFSDTVEANIAYGRPDIEDGYIEAASRLAQAHEFVESLPRRYETRLGERGAMLSGGQRQRLAIARAILSNPRILILDDATAAVDPETEELIRRGMRFVMQDRTTFVIAHRISTVKRADVVIVLEKGRVTQIGTHEQLLNEDGHYRYIAAVQLFGEGMDGDRNGEPAVHMGRLQATNGPATVTVAAGASEESPRGTGAQGA